MSLSYKQLKILGAEATKAFNLYESLDLLDLPAEVASYKAKKPRMDFWRHREVAKATQRVCSFKDMLQSEYRKVKTHFETLSGNLGKAYDTALRDEKDAACHRAPGCEWVRDMHHWMSKAGYSEGYKVTIMRSRFKTSDLADLSEEQLKQLHDTIVNRCRQKLGLGDSWNRNKKQRRKPQTKATGWTADIKINEAAYLKDDGQMDYLPF
jgi:hypothetical protein